MARGMIVNFMIPISALIVATTVLGTLSLRSVASKQREVIVESIENILEKCQHVSAVIPTVEKCCDEMDKVSEELADNIEELRNSISHCETGLRLRPETSRLLRFQV